jgi:pyridoxamine 5'-phosphate oxidase
MTVDDQQSIRQLLRAAKVFPAAMPEFDVSSVPADPLVLFVAWLTEAVEAGVVQPHAMTLATASREGEPTARTLLLKDVDDALWFATSSLSPKGRQVGVNPRVALTFYWREQGRQVRILGEAGKGPREVSAADFTARHPDSRAVALAVRQSAPITDEHDASVKLEEARQRVHQDPEFAPDDWTAYRVAPTSVEFWQATTGRDQVRLRYDRLGEHEWARTPLWP